MKKTFITLTCLTLFSLSSSCLFAAVTTYNKSTNPDGSSVMDYSGADGTSITQTKRSDGTIEVQTKDAAGNEAGAAIAPDGSITTNSN